MSQNLPARLSTPGCRRRKEAEQVRGGCAGCWFEKATRLGRSPWHGSTNTNQIAMQGIAVGIASLLLVRLLLSLRACSALACGLLASIFIFHKCARLLPGEKATLQNNFQGFSSTCRHCQGPRPLLGHPRGLLVCTLVSTTDVRRHCLVLRLPRRTASPHRQILLWA